MAIATGTRKPEAQPKRLRDRAGRSRSGDLRISRSARYRPDGQIAGLRRGNRHGRGQSCTRVQGRLQGFSLAAAILHDLRITRVRLLTNKPRKARALSAAGVDVVERLPCEVVPTAHSLAYLQTKKRKMGHALSLEIPDPGM
jgi:hypothetical protein